ncbi:MAG: hypothetical protein QY325_04305 [Flavobacteriales bacterium]|nr:MAG: hypothetical protein QY325_04305 [Flavobacteriales bacterium]
MRIVIISECDYAGSGQRFAQALRSAGHTCVQVAFRRNKYEYRVDLLAGAHNLHQVQDLIDHADVVHFKGDNLPSHFPQLRTDHKPRVITMGGSAFRRPANKYHKRPWELALWPLAEYKRQAHALGALTPDLLYPGLGAVWTPHATKVARRWKAPRKGEPIIIGHSPSNPEVKGTDTLVKPAVAAMKLLGHNVELRVIRGKSNAECLEAKAACHLFIDQGIIPAYGLSAVEAMAMGIPVITLLPEWHPHMVPCPIYGMQESSPSELYAELDRACYDMQLAYRHKVVAATLAYAERVHGYRAVAKRLTNLYRTAMARAQEKQPRTAAARTGGPGM